MNHKVLTHITHESIPIFIDDESTVLILGSLPSIKSREKGFYYAHPRNRFFLVLSRIFDEAEPKTIEERKAFLTKHHISLYDVIKECDIYGSSDASIKNPKVIPLKEILLEHPNIKKIGVNGGKAKQLFDKYLLNDVKEFGVKVLYLPSTSPANARMSADEIVDCYCKLILSK